MSEFFHRPHGGCYSCRSRSVILSRDRKHGLCLNCGVGFRIEAQAQLKDDQAREVIRREISELK